ncbi:MAG: hypothetical protein ACPGXK_03855 [Phycisphaerae bacterium]
MALFSVVACVWLASSGCVGPSGGANRTNAASDPGSAVDRLMRAYSDLRSGRFMIVADFEKPEQMELVGLVNGSGRARIERVSNAGRELTGATALQFTAGDPDDILVFSNANASDWSLKRDWRSYDLLVMSVLAPRESLLMDVTIKVGGEKGYDTVESTVALEKGWNLTRLDLADVADHIPLGDVREFRLSVRGATSGPVTLTVDDLVLATNRQSIMGDPDGSSLFVERRGRRWHVGSGGQFEIVFAHGQIIGWYNLAEDPYRTRNLAQGTTLTPMPIVLEGDEEYEESWKRGTLRVHPRITEMTPVRVILESDWIHVTEPGADVADQPFQKWRYAVYPTGQIYLSVECSSQTPSWTASRMGLTLGIAATAEDGIQTETRTDASDPPTYALVTSEPSNYAMLFTLDRTARYTRTLHRREDGTRELMFAISTNDPIDGVASWNGLLALSALDSATRFGPSLLSKAYAEPPALELLNGAVATSGRGRSAEGFDPGTGAYRLTPDGGACRFIIHGEEQALAAPVFEIEGLSPGNAWVYVDHQLRETVGEDRDGRLVFQLPGLVHKATLVEVVAKPE